MACTLITASVSASTLRNSRSSGWTWHTAVKVSTSSFRRGSFRQEIVTMKLRIWIRHSFIPPVLVGLGTTVLLGVETQTKAPKFYPDDPLSREVTSQDAS